MKRIAIFGSGSGSNAERICAFFKNSLDVRVVLIASNKKNAFILDRAKKLNIPHVVFSKIELEEFYTLNAFLIKKGVDYIVLAGFLLKIPLKMVLFYSQKIINIHPSLLPKYGGKGMFGNRVHEEVLKNNEQTSGITIHLVNEKYDDGKVLLQKTCLVEKNETVDSLSKKVSSLEYAFFAKTIEKHLLK